MSSRRLTSALREIRSKSQARINLDTANTWAARAIAYRTEARRAERELGRASAKACEAWKGFDDARHEALEHASLVGDGGKTVGRIERLIDGKRKR
jgi:hypothetical protein